MGIRKRNGFWNKENCIIDAKKYIHRSEWFKKSSSAYTASHKNGWLDECCKHMEVIGNRFKRMIYAFEFSDKSVYIGLTYNSEIREAQHLNPTQRKKSAVYEYIKKTNLQPKFIELTSYVDKDQAIINENKFVEQYKAEGWNILNKNKTGSIGGGGGNILKWTYETCKSDALKYQIKNEWRINSSRAYCVACKNNWLEECCIHMIEINKPKNYWKIEMCKIDALKYNHKIEWKKNSPGAYDSALNNKWVDECTKHMIRPIHWRLK